MGLVGYASDEFVRLKLPIPVPGMIELPAPDTKALVDETLDAGEASRAREVCGERRRVLAHGAHVHENRQLAARALTKLLQRLQGIVGNVALPRNDAIHCQRSDGHQNAGGLKSQIV